MFHKGDKVLYKETGEEYIVLGIYNYVLDDKSFYQEIQTDRGLLNSQRFIKI